MADAHPDVGPTALRTRRGPPQPQPPLPPSVSTPFSRPSRPGYGVWDFRRNAMPPYHPEHQPHYSERAFYPKQRKRAITLRFRPCGRADLMWSATVKAASCGKHLNVGDVLRTISTELLGRSVCRDVREGDLCYAGAGKAQRVRTRRGHSTRAHRDDELRNVDLYHTDHVTKLLFEGLRPERTDDGEVGYLVVFSCA